MNGESVRIVSDLVQKDLWWGTIYKGTKDSLVGAGICKPEWLADGSECDRRGRTVRSKRIECDGKRVETHQRGSRKYEVWIRYPEHELERRRKREEFNKVQAEADRMVSSLPSSHQQFRDQVAKLLAGALPLAIPSKSASCGGYRYSEDARHEINEAVEALLAALLQGGTVFSAKDRAEHIASIRANTAKADEGLQDFLRKVAEN